MSVISVRDQACAGHRNIYRHQTVTNHFMKWPCCVLFFLVISDYFQKQHIIQVKIIPARPSRTLSGNFLRGLQYLCLFHLHSNTEKKTVHNIGFVLCGDLDGQEPLKNAPNMKPASVSCHQSILHLLRFASSSD